MIQSVSQSATFRAVTISPPPDGRRGGVHGVGHRKEVLQRKMIEEYVLEEEVGGM